MNTVFITGVSKGLGKALAEKYHSKGYFIIGLSRTGVDFYKDNAVFIRGDVTDPGIIDTIKRETADIDCIDIVINNAGAGSYGSRISEISPKAVIQQVDLHCVGVLRIVKAVYLLLQRSDNAKIVNITSRLGSIQQHVRGDFRGRDEFSYGYIIGKCAQNMLSLCMRNDCDLKNAIIMSVNPGLLLTDSGASDAKYTAEDAADKIFSLVDSVRESGMYHAFGDEALY